VYFGADPYCDSGVLQRRSEGTSAHHSQAAQGAIFDATWMGDIRFGCDAYRSRWRSTMVHKMIFVLAAAAVMAVASASSTALARGGGHGGGSGGGGHGGGFGGGGFGHAAMAHPGGYGGFAAVHPMGRFGYGHGVYVRHGFARRRFAVVGVGYPYGYYGDCYVRVWTGWGWSWRYVCY
jgi:hypothetical protein